MKLTSRQLREILSNLPEPWRVGERFKIRIPKPPEEILLDFSVNVGKSTLAKDYLEFVCIPMASGNRRFLEWELQLESST